MHALVARVEKHITAADPDCIPDIDEVINNVRLSVAFGSFLHRVSLRSAEVFDADWELLPEDSAVLASRIRYLLDDYNRDLAASMCQASEIAADRLSEW